MEIKSRFLLEKLGFSMDQIERLENKTIKIVIFDEENKKSSGAEQRLIDFVSTRDFYKIDLSGMIINVLLDQIEKN